MLVRIQKKMKIIEFQVKNERTEVCGTAQRQPRKQAVKTGNNMTEDEMNIFQTNDQ